ncbi:MAG: PASTA domain-containing protein [Bacteroidota bacterium]
MGNVILKYRAIIHTKFLKINSVFTIEIFNSQNAEWFTFIDQIKLRDNALIKQRTITEDETKKDKDIQFLLDQIGQNNYPKTRIRVFDKGLQMEIKSRSMKIVAQNYNVKRTMKTVVFDFEENWLLKEEDFSNFKDIILVGTQHNIYRLYERMGQSEDQVQEMTGKLTETLTTLDAYKTEIDATRNLLEERSNQLTKSEENAKFLADQKKNLEDSVAFGNIKTIEDQKTIDNLKKSNTTLEERVTLGIENYAKLEKEFADYKEAKESVHPNKVAAKKVYTNFVRDVSSADEALQNSNYKLANISLDIRATVEDDGNGVILGLIDYDSLQTIKGGEGISSIKVDIERNTSIQELTFKVPNVTGMTFSKFKSTLIDAGYKLEPIYQNPNADRVNGLSVKQFPASGTEYQQGETVSVIFQ